MRRKKRPTKITCSVRGCGKTADLKDNPHAWDGWRIIPNTVCPSCLAKLDKPGTMKDKIRVHETRSAGKVMKTFQLVGL